jgi:hypothetical protein
LGILNAFDYELLRTPLFSHRHSRFIRGSWPCGIRIGLDQVERGEAIPHDEVKRQLATWLSK